MFSVYLSCVAVYALHDVCVRGILIPLGSMFYICCLFAYCSPSPSVVELLGVRVCDDDIGEEGGEGD